jgi:chromosomal replication initiator protein
VVVTCFDANDPNLVKLAQAIAKKVGAQRFHVWFDNSTRLDLRNDSLEIAVPNDFIGEWIGQKFTGTIQEAAVEVFGGPLRLRFQVVPELFEKKNGETGPAINPGSVHPDGSANNGHGYGNGHAHGNGQLNGHSHSGHTHNGYSHGAASHAHPAHGNGNGHSVNGNGHAGGATSRDVNVRPFTSSGRSDATHNTVVLNNSAATQMPILTPCNRHRLRHELDSYVVGPANQLAFNAALHVSEYPGAQYNPLFVHGSCGLGKTHLLQGLCSRFSQIHPTRKWLYLTAEEFTNEYLAALRGGKVEIFRRRTRELDLLVIDDVHFLSGKKATQEEFLHTFNAIEALGRQVVMASDSHPKEISEFGESLVNRFVSGMVVRVDPPNLAMRCEILRRICTRQKLNVSPEVQECVARRVTQNVRELEGAATRIQAHAQLTGRGGEIVGMELAQQALGDLDRAMVAPVKPENVLQAVAGHFGIEAKDLMSGRRHHTVSLARSVAMFLVRKTGKLSYPEIGHRLGKRNHSTVISACRRIEAAVQKNEKLSWSGALGEREEEATELVQRLEEHARAMA